MTARSIIDIHILQTVPPSNVNRDDTGSPKTAVFGGVRRARVSSQAWKRATRVAFEDLLDRSELGVRTTRAVEFIADEIAKRRPDFEETSYELATKVLSSTGIKVKASKRKRTDDDAHQETGYLLFLSRLQIERLAEAAIDAAPDGDPESLKGFKGRPLLNTEHSVDLALFGRMVADVSDLNVDASCQVAHAISVHGVETEYDYFTAVDDAKRESDSGDDEDAGAAMIGTVEFNSSTLYRYATLNVDGLRQNLGDTKATLRGVSAFIQAFVESMPTGKQNTFANRTLPDLVLVQVRDSLPINLVGAFENPVEARAGASRVQDAAVRLAERAQEIADAYGQTPVSTWAVGLGETKKALDSISEEMEWQWTNFAELPAEVAAILESRLVVD